MPGGNPEQPVRTDAPRVRSIDASTLALKFNEQLPPTNDYEFGMGRRRFRQEPLPDEPAALPVHNGGFEDSQYYVTVVGGVGVRRYAGWTVEGTVEEDADVAHGGAHYARFGAMTFSGVRIDAERRWRVRPGQTYRYTVYVRRDPASLPDTAAVAGFRFDGHLPASASNAIGFGGSVNVSKDIDGWQTISGTAVVPAGTVWMQWRIVRQTGAAGHFLVDDFSVERVE